MKKFLIQKNDSSQKSYYFKAMSTSHLRIKDQRSFVYITRPLTFKGKHLSVEKKSFVERRESQAENKQTLHDTTQVKTFDQWLGIFRRACSKVSVSSWKVLCRLQEQSLLTMRGGNLRSREYTFAFKRNNECSICQVFSKLMRYFTHWKLSFFATTYLILFGMLIQPSCSTFLKNSSKPET